MEQKKGQRYSSEFSRQAVERMNAGDNIVRLARELGDPSGFWLVVKPEDAAPFMDALKAAYTIPRLFD